MTNRSEINRCLSKALAYAERGKFDEAQRYGENLVVKLELAGVFKAGVSSNVYEPSMAGDLVPMPWLRC